MEISDQILRNALKRVHFLWGNGKTAAAVALKAKYGCYVYRLGRRKWEDFTGSERTAMVLCDLMARTGAHRRIVCLEELDMEAVLPLMSHGAFLRNAGEPCEVFEGPEEGEMLYEIRSGQALTVARWQAMEATKVVPMVTWTALSTPESVAEEIARIWGW